MDGKGIATRIITGTVLIECWEDFSKIYWGHPSLCLHLRQDRVWGLHLLSKKHFKNTCFQKQVYDMEPWLQTQTRTSSYCKLASCIVRLMDHPAVKKNENKENAPPKTTSCSGIRDQTQDPGRRLGISEPRQGSWVSKEGSTKIHKNPIH